MCVRVHMCVCACVYFFSFPFVVFSSAIATYSNQHCPHFTTLSYASIATSWNTTGKPPLSQSFKYRCLHGKYLLLPATAHHGPSILLPFMANTKHPFFRHLMQCCLSEHGVVVHKVSMSLGYGGHQVGNLFYYQRVALGYAYCCACVILIIACALFLL